MDKLTTLLPNAVFENGKTVHMGDLWAVAEDFGTVTMDGGWHDGYHVRIAMQLPGGSFYAKGVHRRAEEALSAAITSAHNATIALGG